MIRELAENPNVHQRLSSSQRLICDPDGRYAIFLNTGSGPHSATVQRVRLEAEQVAGAVAEIRSILRENGRTGAEWELGDSCTPTDLVEQLAGFGIHPDPDEPLAIGMVLRDPGTVNPPPGATARRVETVEELMLAQNIQGRAFGQEETADDQTASQVFQLEGVNGSTFLAFVDGVPAGAAYAAYTPLGLLLFGGATLHEMRGRGAYRALVAARAREAIKQGTPLLVTHAGKMSRPILDRIGFVPVSTIVRLLDVF